MGCYTPSYQHMMIVAAILKGLLLLSLIATAIVLGSKGVLFSCGGIIGWAFVSVLLWIVLSLIFSPILIIIAFIGAAFRF